MNPRLLLALVFVAALRAADEPEAPRSSAREALRARIAEDAKKKATQPAPKSAPAAAAAQKAEPTSPAPEPAKPAEPVATPTAKTAAGKETATVLPKVEVRKERLTILDVEIAKQEEAIAREKRNLKPSEADLALNDIKVAKPLAIFGGESAQFRKRVAAERVELMEAEKDILEAMKRARTKEEKAALQKQLDEIRTARRELDKTAR